MELLNKAKMIELSSASEPSCKQLMIAGCCYNYLIERNTSNNKQDEFIWGSVRYRTVFVFERLMEGKSNSTDHNVSFCSTSNAADAADATDSTGKQVSDSSTSDDGKTHRATRSGSGLPS